MERLSTKSYTISIPFVPYIIDKNVYLRGNFILALFRLDIQITFCFDFTFSPRPILHNFRKIRLRLFGRRDRIVFSYLKLN